MKDPEFVEHVNPPFGFIVRWWFEDRWRFEVSSVERINEDETI